MAITQLFSKTQDKLAGVSKDVYTYDIPKPLRVKITLILQDSVEELRSDVDDFYKLVHKKLCMEYGVFSLKQETPDVQAIYDYLYETENVEHVLDVIQVCISSLPVKELRTQGIGIEILLDNTGTIVGNAVRELNERFKEHAVGYQIESTGHIIKIDSSFIHSETVKPTLVLLSDSAFAGAQEEFLNAHEHYRQGRNKECLVDCLKSFESVIKTICTKRSWAFNQTDPAKKLIDVLFANSLIPSFMQSKFDGLRALLESGVPTIRNKLGGHGQGASVTAVPNHIASYALHLTATNILFLVESEKALP